MGLLRGDLSLELLNDYEPMAVGAPASGDSLLKEIGWFASQTFDINADAVKNPRLVMATLAAAAVWTWSWDAAGNSALPFLGTVLLNLVLLAAGKLLSTVSELAVEGDQNFSWAVRRQHLLFWVAYALWVLSYTLIPLRAASAAYLASTPFASSSA